MGCSRLADPGVDAAGRLGGAGITSGSSDRDGGGEGARVGAAPGKPAGWEAARCDACGCDGAAKHGPGAGWLLFYSAFGLGFLHIFGYAFTCRALGPRYYFEAVPFFMVLLGGGLFSFRKLAWFRRAGGLVLLSCMLYSLGYYWPHFIALVRFQPISRVDWRLADRIIPLVGPAPALVFCDVGIRWDIYLSLFARMSPALDDPCLFARDLGARNPELARLHPERALFFLAAERVSGENRYLFTLKDSAGRISGRFFSP